MKSNKLCLVVFLFFNLFFFSCRIQIDSSVLIAHGGKPNSTSTGSDGEDQSTTSSGTNSGQGEGDSGAGTGSLSQLAGKFVRPVSGGNITLTPSEDCDIWYLFTNMSRSNIAKPSYTIPDTYKNIVAKENLNLINQFLLKDFSIDTSDGPVMIDYRPENPVISFGDIGDLEFGNLVQKNGLTTKSPATEKVGDNITFYDNNRELTATCKLKRTVSTSNGNRTLLIYTEDNVPSGVNMPSASEINTIADAFLKDGLDNDIYDKVTALFGNDIGLYNQSKYSYLIEADNTITLLYCNLGNQGPLENGAYTAGYYYSGNNILDTILCAQFSERSNERSMVTLYGPACSGTQLGSGLTTLAHEFQHLIHTQHYCCDESHWATECFSSISEGYVADFLRKKTGQDVPGPFYVGYNKNTSGYLTSSSDPMAFINGRGPYFLGAMTRYAIESWNQGLEDYGMVASFGAYLLVNYGKEVISNYMIQTDSKDLDGLVKSINTVKNNGDMTKLKLVADWGTACLLSNRTNIDPPYAFNRHGWYSVNGMNVPSINFWLYANNSNSTYGFTSSSTNTLLKGTNTPYKVGSVSANQEFRATAPVLPSDVVLTVVAVPR